jgi:DNA-binding beta-propeller fold protein YncE
MYKHFQYTFTILGLSLVAGPAACDSDALEVSERSVGAVPGAAPKFTAFDAGHVRPLALSPCGDRLFAVNTPDSRLEVYEVKDSGKLRHRSSIPVGLEPVAVAVRDEDEVWVVNHLSDSVSVVRMDSDFKGHVERTLLVGDEPRDLVFAGPDRRRAFITTAHRGQNSVLDAQTTTPGVGRSDVWVFDAASLGAAPGGAPLTVVQLFADTPRALAVDPTGTRVYAATFNSGNRTTTVHRNTLAQTREADGGPPAPNENHAGVHQPLTGLIVKHDGEHWLDEIGRVWDHKVNFNLPDNDVFVLDATADPPVQLAGAAGVYRGVGTTIFNLAVNPATGTVYAANTEAFNHIRFSGPSHTTRTTVQGHIAESRISVLTSGGAVSPRPLNKHIDYTTTAAATPSEESERSLAIPLDMAVTADGETLYVAALGSSKVGVYSTDELEADEFVPDDADHIEVSGGGPTGLALHEDRHRLYVMTRFDNGISTIDTHTGAELAHTTMHNPEPADVVAGRRFLYDARTSSAHGDTACASCHVFGDIDHLAWDLGDPDGDIEIAPGPFNNLLGLPGAIDLHPMKGPMTTQSLRGMANHGPMHWRGDRSGGFHEPSAQPDEGSFDERAAFLQFNEAFINLQGRAAELSHADMAAFADFALDLTYPPNPHRALDSSLSPAQQRGRDVFFTAPRTLGGLTCESCHRLDPDANAEFGVDKPGFFGTDGRYNGVILDQTLKIPHMRNLYQKVGMFGMVFAPVTNEELDSSFAGDQVRGFGFVRDGGMSTLRHFQQGFVEFPEGHPLHDLSIGGFALDAAGQQERLDIEQFLLVFDSNLAPVVGQQITLTKHNAAAAGPRIDLLIARATAGECELTVHGKGKAWLLSGGLFHPDAADAATRTDAQLRSKVDEKGDELTYTCVPVGSGRRHALDRDLDGTLNRDED